MAKSTLATIAEAEVALKNAKGALIDLTEKKVDELASEIGDSENTVKSIYISVNGEGGAENFVKLSLTDGAEISVRWINCADGTRVVM